MKIKGWMGLATALVLSGCGMFQDKPQMAVEAAPVPASTGTGWIIVSCHLDGRGCREESSHGSESACKVAARDFELDNKERRAACRRTGG